MSYPVDIVIPVWNRPVETRSCLASLVASSPESRLIMVNYGSERETERILDEFAEALDDRAMLVSTERNIGRVAALNHGIGLAAAPVVVIVQDDLTVRPGWLESLTAVISSYHDVGLAVPSRVNGKGATGDARQFREVDHGSLGVMALRRELVAAVGGLDAEMDGGVWCLRDYSRRATRSGYKTVCVPSCRLSFGEPQLLGSVVRQEERVRQGERMYLQRWGEPRRFCFPSVGPTAGPALAGIAPLIMVAARQGHRVHILADREAVRSIAGLDEPLAHEGIVIDQLPKFFTRRALKKGVDRLMGAYPDTLLVDCEFPPGSAGTCSMNEFASLVDEYQAKYFGTQGAHDAG